MSDQTIERNNEAFQTYSTFETQNKQERETEIEREVHEPFKAAALEEISIFSQSVLGEEVQA